MDKEKLNVALDWAHKNEDTDSMAAAYLGLCIAIGSIDEESACASKIVNDKTGEDEHPIDSELFKADENLDALFDHLCEVRDGLCGLINKIIAMPDLEQQS